MNSIISIVSLVVSVVTLIIIVLLMTRPGRARLGIPAERIKPSPAATERLTHLRRRTAELERRHDELADMEAELNYQRDLLAGIAEMRAVTRTRSRRPQQPPAAP